MKNNVAWASDERGIDPKMSVTAPNNQCHVPHFPRKKGASTPSILFYSQCFIININLQDTSNI